jgi:hypothetical protein
VNLGRFLGVDKCRDLEEAGKVNRDSCEWPVEMSPESKVEEKHVSTQTQEE